MTKTVKTPAVNFANAEKILYDYIVGHGFEESIYEDDIEEGLGKLPKELYDSYDQWILPGGFSREDDVYDFHPMLHFYVKYRHYFSERLVKLSEDLINAFAEGNEIWLEEPFWSYKEDTSKTFFKLFLEKIRIYVK